jgi:hypothetical protein
VTLVMVLLPAGVHAAGIVVATRDTKVGVLTNMLSSHASVCQELLAPKQRSAY